MNSIKRCVVCPFLILLLVFVACQQKTPLVRFSGRTMGTTYQVQIVTAQSLNNQGLQQAIDSLLESINQQMSTFRPNSEISRFNRWHSTQPFTVSPSFAYVVRKALEIFQQSNGAFDITVGPLVDLWGFGKKGVRFEPPDSTAIQQALKRVGAQMVQVYGDSALVKQNPSLEIDLSAIAKGFGVDAVAQLLKQKGFQNFMVEIGGEVYASGKRGERPWHIGVDQPQYQAPPGKNVEMVLAVENCAIATSGDYRNFFEFKGKIYSHEIDPRTGYPVHNGLASVTVIAPQCMVADAMATAIMVLGAEKGLQWVNNTPNVEALILKRLANNRFKKITSNGFARYLLE